MEDGLFHGPRFAVARAGSAWKGQGGRASDSEEPVAPAERSCFCFPAPPTATTEAARGSGADERRARRSRGRRPVPAPVAASREGRAGRPRRAARSSAPREEAPATAAGLERNGNPAAQSVGFRRPHAGAVTLRIEGAGSVVDSDSAVRSMARSDRSGTRARTRQRDFNEGGFLKRDGRLGRADLCRKNRPAKAEREADRQKSERRVRKPKGRSDNRRRPASSRPFPGASRGQQVRHLATEHAGEGRHDLHGQGAFALLDIGQMRLGHAHFFGQLALKQAEGGATRHDVPADLRGHGFGHFVAHLKPPRR